MVLKAWLCFFWLLIFIFIFFTSLGWFSMIHNLIFAKQFLNVLSFAAGCDRTDGLPPSAQIQPGHF